MSIATDGLMGLCKLADIHHRINRANEHDTHQVSTWLETERARSATSQISSDDRQMKLALLRGEDEDKVVEKSFESLRAELDTLGGELAKAEDEEEQARRVSADFRRMRLLLILATALDRPTRRPFSARGSRRTD